MNWFNSTIVDGRIIGVISDPDQVASILEEEGLDLEEIRQIRRLTRACGMSLYDFARADQSRLLDHGGGCCALVSDVVRTMGANTTFDGGCFIIPGVSRAPHDWYSGPHTWLRFLSSNALLDPTADQFGEATGGDVVIIPADTMAMVHYQSNEPPIWDRRLGRGLPRGKFRKNRETDFIRRDDRVFVIITEVDEATYKNPFAEALYLGLCPFWIEEDVADVSIILGPEDELPPNVTGCLIHGERALTPIGQFPTVRYNVSPGFVSDDDLIIEDPIAGGNIWDPRHYRFTGTVWPVLQDFVVRFGSR